MCVAEVLGFLEDILLYILQKILHALNESVKTYCLFLEREI